jgi:small subunit ribosomal protein S2
MKELLEAGVHFGHQVRRWNPKMKEYIFGERNGIYIIDLQKTQRMFRDALQFVQDLTANERGRTVLFVGTKRQAQDSIKEEAERCGMYYINNRWLGGLLTNFQTVRESIKKLKDLEAMQTDGRYDKLTKKERIQRDRERETLTKNLAGIKNMTRLPDALFIIDVRKEDIAVKEANRLGIPVVAVVDTNCSPEGVDWIIPGNDDALRAVRLFAARVADAVLEGQQMNTEGAADDAVMMEQEEVTETAAEGAGKRRRRKEADAVAEETAPEAVAETPAEAAPVVEEVAAPAVVEVAETVAEEAAPVVAEAEETVAETAAPAEEAAEAVAEGAAEAEETVEAVAETVEAAAEAAADESASVAT